VTVLIGNAVLNISLKLIKVLCCISFDFREFILAAYLSQYHVWFRCPLFAIYDRSEWLFCRSKLLMPRLHHNLLGINRAKLRHHTQLHLCMLAVHYIRRWLSTWACRSLQRWSANTLLCLPVPARFAACYVHISLSVFKLWLQINSDNQLSLLSSVYFYF